MIWASAGSTLCTPRSAALTEDALALVRCRYELHAEPYPALEAEEMLAADELRDMLLAVTSCES